MESSLRRHSTIALCTLETPCHDTQASKTPDDREPAQPENREPATGLSDLSAMGWKSDDSDDDELHEPPPELNMADHTTAGRKRRAVTADARSQATGKDDWLQW